MDIAGPLPVVTGGSSGSGEANDAQGSPRLWAEPFAADQPGSDLTASESQIARIIRVFEAFDSAQGLRASEIARRSDLPMPTAHRLVRALASHGLLVRDPDLKYRVAIRLWELGRRSSAELSLRDRALPFLEDVQSVLRSHTQLCVLDGIEIVVVERLSNPAASSVNVLRVGGRMPAAAISCGIIMAAFASEERQESIARSSWYRYTSRTPTSPETIRQELAKARKQGFVIGEGWIHESAVGIAVPIRDPLGGVCAALSATVPVGSELVNAAVPALLTAANGITRSLSRRKAAVPHDVLALESFFRRSQHLRLVPKS